MTTDASSPIAGPPRPDWELPEIVDIKIRRVPFRPRKRKFVTSTLAEHKEATEFTVQLSGAIPARAMPPALFVGGTPVIESELVEGKVYRFLAFDDQPLRNGAAIAWGWLDAPPKERMRTNFRFRATE